MNKINKLFFAFVLANTLSITLQGNSRHPNKPNFLPLCIHGVSALTFGGAVVYGSTCFIESSMLPKSPEFDEQKKELLRKFKQSLKIGGGAALVAVASGIAWFREIVIHSF